MKKNKGGHIYRARDHPVYKTLSTATFFIFTVTSFVWPVPPSSVEAALPQLKEDMPVPSTDQIRIPAEIGIVEEIYEAPPTKDPSPLVIYLQDAHCIYEAQSNIRKIIDKMQKDHALDLVALEGGNGKLDPLLFRTFPVQAIKEKVLDAYLRRGELSGAEYAAVVNERESDFWGIEEMKTYQENKKAFLKAVENKKRIDIRLDDIDRGLKRKIDEIYSPELKELFVKREDYEAKRLDLLAYVNYLTRLRAPRAYSSILFLMEAMDREKGMDLAKVEVEAKNLESALEGALGETEEGGDLASRRASLKRNEITREAFYLWLIAKGKELGLVPEAKPEQKYTALLAYLDHVHEMEKIKGAELFRELEGFIREIKESLFQNEGQRKLDAFLSRLKILRGLAKLELTREELREYQEHKADFSEKHFWDFIGRETNRVELDKLFEPHNAFYQAALKRDEALHRNLRKLIDNEKRKFAMMITGGFHTEGVKEMLKRDGISYVIIFPRITQFDEKTPYWDVMRGKVSYARYLERKALSPELFLLMYKEASEAGILGDFAKLVKENLPLIREGWEKNIRERAPPETRFRYLNTLNRLFKVVEEARPIDAAAITRQIAAAFNLLLKSRSEAAFEKIEELEGKLAELASKGELTPRAVGSVLNELFPDTLLDISELPAEPAPPAPPVAPARPQAVAQALGRDWRQTAAIAAVAMGLLGASGFGAYSLFFRQAEIPAPVTAPVAAPASAGRSLAPEEKVLVMASIDRLLARARQDPRRQRFVALLRDPSWIDRVSVVPAIEPGRHGRGRAIGGGRIEIDEGTLQWAASGDIAGEVIFDGTLLHEKIHDEHFAGRLREDAREGEDEESLTRRQSSEFFGGTLHYDGSIPFGIYIVIGRDGIVQAERDAQGIERLRIFINAYGGEISEAGLNAAKQEEIETLLSDREIGPRNADILRPELERLRSEASARALGEGAGLAVGPAMAEHALVDAGFRALEPDKLNLQEAVRILSQIDPKKVDRNLAPKFIELKIEYRLAKAKEALAKGDVAWAISDIRRAYRYLSDFRKLVPPYIETPIAKDFDRLFAHIEEEAARMREAIEKRRVPLPPEGIKGKGVFAVQGDVHGELEGLKENLRSIGLIDEEGHWIGGQSTLIQLGDVIDEGPMPLEAYQFLEDLQKEAQAQGGKVIRLLGNHEQAMLAGMLDWLAGTLERHPRLGQKLTRDEADKQAGEFRTRFLDDLIEGRVLGAYVFNGRLAVHGGLMPEIREHLVREISKARNIPPEAVTLGEIAERINEILREAARRAREGKGFRDFIELADFHPIFKVGRARGGEGVGGIFWADFTRELDRVASRVAPLAPQIVGHTPPAVEFPMSGAEPFGIRFAEGPSMIGADAGLTGAYGGRRALVVFEPDGTLSVIERRSGEGTYQQLVVVKGPVAVTARALGTVQELSEELDLATHILESEITRIREVPRQKAREVARRFLQEQGKDADRFLPRLLELVELYRPFAPPEVRAPPAAPEVALPERTPVIAESPEELEAVFKGMMGHPTKSFLDDREALYGTSTDVLPQDYLTRQVEVTFYYRELDEASWGNPGYPGKTFAEDPNIGFGKILPPLAVKVPDQTKPEGFRVVQVVPLLGDFVRLSSPGKTAEGKMIIHAHKLTEQEMEEQYGLRKLQKSNGEGVKAKAYTWGLGVVGRMFQFPGDFGFLGKEGSRDIYDIFGLLDAIVTGRLEYHPSRAEYKALGMRNLTQIGAVQGVDGKAVPTPEASIKEGAHLLAKAGLGNFAEEIAKKEAQYQVTIDGKEIPLRELLSASGIFLGAQYQEGSPTIAGTERAVTSLTAMPAEANFQESFHQIPLVGLHVLRTVLEKSGVGAGEAGALVNAGTLRLGHNDSYRFIQLQRLLRSVANRQRRLNPEAPEFRKFSFETRKKILGFFFPEWAGLDETGLKELIKNYVKEVSEKRGASTANFLRGNLIYELINYQHDRDVVKNNVDMQGRQADLGDLLPLYDKKTFMNWYQNIWQGYQKIPREKFADDTWWQIRFAGEGWEEQLGEDIRVVKGNLSGRLTARGFEFSPKELQGLFDEMESHSYVFLVPVARLKGEIEKLKEARAPPEDIARLEKVYEEALNLLLDRALLMRSLDESQRRKSYGIYGGRLMSLFLAPPKEMGDEPTKLLVQIGRDSFEIFSLLLGMDSGVMQFVQRWMVRHGFLDINDKEGIPDEKNWQEYFALENFVDGLFGQKLLVPAERQNVNFRPLFGSMLLSDSLRVYLVLLWFLNEERTEYSLVPETLFGNLSDNKKDLLDKAHLESTLSDLFRRVYSQEKEMGGITDWKWGITDPGTFQSQRSALKLFYPKLKNTLGKNLSEKALLRMSKQAANFFVGLDEEAVRKIFFPPAAGEIEADSPLDILRNIANLGAREKPSTIEDQARVLDGVLSRFEALAGERNPDARRLSHLIRGVIKALRSNSTVVLVEGKSFHLKDAVQQINDLRETLRKRPGIETTQPPAVRPGVPAVARALGSAAFEPLVSLRTETLSRKMPRELAQERSLTETQENAFFNFFFRMFGLPLTAGFGPIPEADLRRAALMFLAEKMRDPAGREKAFAELRQKLEQAFEAVDVETLARAIVEKASFAEANLEGLGLKLSSEEVADLTGEVNEALATLREIAEKKRPEVAPLVSAAVRERIDSYRALAKDPAVVADSVSRFREQVSARRQELAREEAIVPLDSVHAETTASVFLSYKDLRDILAILGREGELVVNVSPSEVEPVSSRVTDFAKDRETIQKVAEMLGIPEVRVQNLIKLARSLGQKPNFGDMNRRIEKAVRTNQGVVALVNDVVMLQDARGEIRSGGYNIVVSDPDQLKDIPGGMEIVGAFAGELARLVPNEDSDRANKLRKKFVRSFGDYGFRMRPDGSIYLDVMAFVDQLEKEYKAIAAVKAAA